tara:strand:- start:565 stop:1014 length:450 start_codon:yes stop_codon:yes gene_type:complete
MSEHVAKLDWKRGEDDFAYKNYSRNHSWEFQNGDTLIASAAPQYLGDPTKVDPEQAFVASLASCHMLTFLAIASMQRKTVDAYQDKAIGRLAKNPQGKMVISTVDLYPIIKFAPGSEPTQAELQAMHDKAHQECFLANSVTCEIVTHIQ